MQNLRKMEDFKSKFLNIINNVSANNNELKSTNMLTNILYKFQKNAIKVPAMGFNTALKDLSITPETYASTRYKDDVDKAENEEESILSDQEILESTEAIYFAPFSETGSYEMRVSSTTILLNDFMT